MRGHWLSQTRKLNKHYQNGSGGVIPRPDFEYLPYITGGSFIPTLFENDPEYESLNGDERFYNKMMNTITAQYWNHYGNIYPTANFAMVQCWLGPISRKYDGFYKSPAGDYIRYNPATSSAMWKWYWEMADSHERAIWDPDQYNEDTRWYSYGRMKTVNPDTYWDAGDLNLYYSLGKRYVKFKCPKWGYAPPYNYGEPDPDEPVDRYSNSERFGTEIRLSARACKEFASLARRHQDIVFAMLYNGELVTNVVGDTWTVAIGADDDTVENLYDLELAGQAYYENTVTFHIRPLERDITCQVRVYLFCYNGEYYVDQKVHFFRDGEEFEIPGLEGFLHECSFPSCMMGDCYAAEYSQPDDEYYRTYPSYNNYFRTIRHDVGSGIAKTMCAMEYISKPPESGILNVNMPFGENNRLLVLDVDEEDFWEAERLWHLENGGTPYLTE